MGLRFEGWDVKSSKCDKHEEMDILYKRYRSYFRVIIYLCSKARTSARMNRMNDDEEEEVMVECKGTGL